ncbi:MAG: hypothetical protein ACKO3R_01810 [bacterium]
MNLVIPQGYFNLEKTFNFGGGGDTDYPERPRVVVPLDTGRAIGTFLAR